MMSIFYITNNNKVIASNIEVLPNGPQDLSTTIQITSCDPGTTLVCLPPQQKIIPLLEMLVKSGVAELKNKREDETVNGALNRLFQAFDSHLTIWKEDTKNRFKETLGELTFSREFPIVFLRDAMSGAEDLGMKFLLEQLLSSEINLPLTTLLTPENRSVLKSQLSGVFSSRKQDSSKGGSFFRKIYGKSKIIDYKMDQTGSAITIISPTFITLAEIKSLANDMFEIDNIDFYDSEKKLIPARIAATIDEINKKYKAKINKDLDWVQMLQSPAFTVFLGEEGLDVQNAKHVSHILYDKQCQYINKHTEEVKFSALIPTEPNSFAAIFGGALKSESSRYLQTIPNRNRPTSRGSSPRAGFAVQDSNPFSRSKKRHSTAGSNILSITNSHTPLSKKIPPHLNMPLNQGGRKTRFSEYVEDIPDNVEIENSIEGLTEANALPSFTKQNNLSDLHTATESANRNRKQYEKNLIGALATVRSRNSSIKSREGAQTGNNKIGYKFYDQVRKEMQYPEVINQQITTVGSVKEKGNTLKAVSKPGQKLHVQSPRETLCHTMGEVISKGGEDQSKKAGFKSALI